jgi:peroxin-19
LLLETLNPSNRSAFSLCLYPFRQICALYETAPEDFPRLMHLMQEMQECGQPPEEIVKDLAPNMAFGPDGLPVIPGGAAAGAVAAGEGPEGDCTVM